MSRVITAGETMMLAAPPAPGRLRHAAGLSISAGGAESNVAVGLSRLGISAGWLSALGEDEPGELVLNRLRAEGVDTSGVLRRPGHPTGLYLRERVGGSVRVYYYRRGSAASTLAPGDVDPAVLATAEVLHVSGITAALSPECAEFLPWLIDRAREAGCLVSYDVNFRARLWSASEARAATEALLDRIDVLLVGHDEARAVWGWDPETCLDRLSRSGPSQVLVKLGRGGCAAVVGGQRYDDPGFPVTEVDPVGAGDAFDAGYLAGLLWDRPVAERLRIANALGACCVQSVGDYEGLPSRDELDAFVHGRDELGR